MPIEKSTWMDGFNAFWDRIEFLNTIIEMNINGYSLKDGREVTVEQAKVELKELLN
jgi:hypothetical protein